MHMTQHFGQRMSHRGVTKDLVDLVLAHGEQEGDRAILNQKSAKRLLAELQHQQRIVKKIIDKGGLVVVSTGETLITTYNYGVSEH